MAKSLKEALLEQMAALQERGLAPGEIPAEQEEEPSYANYAEDVGGRGWGGERDREPRRRPARAAKPRTGGAQPLRRERDLREPRGGRDRRPREGREGREAIVEGPAVLPAMPVRPPMPPRPGAPPRPFVGGPGPAPGPRPQASRSEMLRRNAERMQREQTERSEIRDLLATYNGGEIDDAAVEKFFSQLNVETGALPPLNVVLEALKNAGNADPAEVGHQVRLHYRRARSRQAPAPVGAR